MRKSINNAERRTGYDIFRLVITIIIIKEIKNRIYRMRIRFLNSKLFFE